MSSSNLVRITFIPEVTYGITPGAGNFKTARFTNDSLSGSPETTESQQIRTDRLSSGQVVTGLTVGGDISFELSKEAALEEFFRGAMMSNWVTSAPISVNLTIAIAGSTITRASGDWNTDVEVGDVILLGSFSNSENNVEVMVVEIQSATVIKYVGPEGIVNETGAGTTFERLDYIDIGTTKYSFSVEKAFLDLTDKAIIYRGELVSGFSLTVAYGEIITGSFTFAGNDYEAVDVAADFITDGRTIDPAATTNSMNGSVDMAFLATGAGASFSGADFCIQSIELSLDNGLQPQNCIGQAAPEDYTLGTATIDVSITAYLSDEAWSLLAKKLSQESFAVGFIVKNVDGAYAFFMPAVQVSFDDPGSQGINTDVLINMTGKAKVGANGESSIRIFKSA